MIPTIHSRSDKYKGVIRDENLNPRDKFGSNMDIIIIL